MITRILPFYRSRVSQNALKMKSEWRWWYSLDKNRKVCSENIFTLLKNFNFFGLFPNCDECDLKQFNCHYLNHDTFLCNVYSSIKGYNQHTTYIPLGFLPDKSLLLAFLSGPDKRHSVFSQYPLTNDKFSWKQTNINAQMIHICHNMMTITQFWQIHAKVTFVNVNVIQNGKKNLLNLMLIITIPSLHKITHTHSSASLYFSFCFIKVLKVVSLLNNSHLTLDNYELQLVNSNFNWSKVSWNND